MSKVFICNTTQSDMEKIKRLKMDLEFGPPCETPGFTVDDNRRAGLIGVYGKVSDANATVDAATE